jgi:hypothetical protein
MAAATVPVSSIAAKQPSSRLPTVPCDRIILVASSGTEGGYRVVLGTVSVPGARNSPTASPTLSEPWPYFRKMGLVIRAGSPSVVISVAEKWRGRAVITWGGNQDPKTALRIASCPSYGKPWNVYAGGLYLRSPTGCVDLVFSVGRRSTTVRFAIGARCDG